MENTMRFRRKNEMALKIVIALSAIRFILTLISGKYLASKAWMIIQLVLCVALIAGCVVMYQMMTDSELTKYICCLSFILITTISVFNNDELHNVLPYCAIIVATLVYLDERFSALCAGICSAMILLKSIVLFAAKDQAEGGAWFFAMIFFIVIAYCLYVTASSVVRAQETDQQEIKYHLMYQEEITQNMVKVVDDGNQHIAQLQSKLDNFQEATDEVARSVDAISQGVTETAMNIESQTDMTAQIQKIIDNLIQVKDRTVASTKEAVNATETGGDVVEKLRAKSDEIAVANKSVTGVAHELQEKISSAEEITQIIYQVSSQTNLLALNASIEAARAGEAGRGFSVVADEIRNLADNTKQSIDKITELLQGLTVLADQTSRLVMNSVQASEAQAEYISDVTNAFRSISGVVEELDSNMQGLDTLSTNLRESNNVIIDNLTNQQAASEEIAANAQSSADLSQNNLDDLEEVIGELDQIAEIIGSLRQLEGMEEAASKSQAGGATPSGPEGIGGQAGGFTPPSPESLAEEAGGFTPPSPESLAGEAGGFTPPSPESLAEEAGGFTPPSPESLAEEAGGFRPPSPESLMSGDEW